jgi:hypothetical protein
MVKLSVPWVSWNIKNPPLIVKLSALFVSGGAPSIRDALLASFDVWRHRSWSFNKSVVKSRLAK